MSDRIPVEVKLDDLMAALQPLGELLHVDLAGVYADPPITIGGYGEHDASRGRITFTIPPTGVPTAGVRPKGIPDASHPQGDEWAELRSLVSIEIVP